MTVWKRAPKHKYCGRKTVQTVEVLAVMQFNAGSKALSLTVDALGLQASSILARRTAKIDATRIRKAEQAAKNESRTQRKRSALSKIQTEQQLVANEGNLYDAGGH